MWTGVLMLLVSTSLLTINFAGFLGWYTDNKMLLKMYALCLSASFAILIIIAVACFIFAASDALDGYTQRALGMSFRVDFSMPVNGRIYRNDNS